MFIQDFMKRKKRAQKMKEIKAATIAAGMGVATGVLIAPKSGKETRKDIAQNAEKATKALIKAADDVKESVKTQEEKMGKNIKETAEKVKDALSKTIDDAAKATDDAKDKLKSKVADAAEVIEDKAKQVKKDANDKK